MPLFFFHLRDRDYLHEDSEGVELPDIHAALEEAARAIRELAAEPSEIYYGLEFEIADSSGRVILRVPIHERRRNPNLPPLSGAQGEERRSSPVRKPHYRH